MKHFQTRAAIGEFAWRIGYGPFSCILRGRKVSAGWDGETGRLDIVPASEGLDWVKDWRG